MKAEVALLREQNYLVLQKLRLEQQERFLKLKPEIARAEVKEKVQNDLNVIEEDEYKSRMKHTFELLVKE